MPKPVFVFLFILKGMLVFAQQPKLRWADQFKGGIDNDVAKTIKQGQNGNIYTIGIFRGTVDFDPGPAVYNLTSAGAEDIFITKVDADGKLLWVKRIGNTRSEDTYAMTVDANENVYLSASFDTTLDADPGNGVHNIDPAGTALDFFLLKLNKDGDFIWVKQFGGVKNFNAGPSGISIDAVGNLILSGSFMGTVDFDPGAGIFELSSKGNITTPIFARPDVFVLKLTPAGDLIWVKQMGGTGADRDFRMTLDAAGIYLTGPFEGTADFDPGPAVYNIVSKGSEDFFVCKLDLDGNFNWCYTAGGTSTDWAFTPVVDAAGNVYTTGFFTTTVDFDNGPGIFNMTAAGDAVFILKLDPSGNFVWAKAIAGPGYNNWGYGMEIDRLGDLYIDGFFIGNNDFDPGPGTFMINSQMRDGFLLKLHNNGDFVWASSLGGAGDDQESGLLVDKFLNIYTTGHFSGTADFDPQSTVYNLTCNDASDGYLRKLAQCIHPSDTTIVTTACKSYDLNGQVYTLSGIYKQQVFNVTGCDSTITLDLTITTEVFSTVSPEICEGQSYFAGGAQQTMPGTYKDTLITAAGCDSIITTHLNVLPAPKPDLGPDRNLCLNAFLLLDPGLFPAYSWQDNSLQRTFTVSTTGKYWVTVKNNYGCSNTDTLNILAIDTLPNNFLLPDQELCYGTALTIAVPGYKDYLWSNGQITNIVTLSSFGKFYLTVTDFNNCKGKDSITLIRKDCIPIGIPNAFTPNGDAKNDVFKPTINQDIRNYSFMVYNRYGEKIFDTKSYGTGWDGTYKGKPQPIGTYVYHIVYTNIFGIVSDNKGTVMLLR
jgi:gliding motility-associated-like protein